MPIDCWSRLWSKKKTTPSNFKVVAENVKLPHAAADWSDQEAQAQGYLRANQDNVALTLLTEIPVQARTVKIWGLIVEIHALRHDWEEFNSCAEEAVNHAENPAAMQALLGEICFEYKNIEAALDWFQVAVELDSNQPRAWLRLGDIYGKKNHHSFALLNYEQAYHRSSDALKVTSGFQLGQTLHVLRRFEEARKIYEEVLIQDPDHLLTWMALGHIELIQDHAEAALKCYERAYYLSTPYPPDSLRLHYGTALRFLGRWDAALEQFQIAWRHNPKDLIAQWYYCQCLLGLECWSEGWPLYQQGRFSDKAPRPMPFPFWQGQTIPGKTLLLLAEQGLGDEIMFASCISDVIEKSQANTILVECDVRLVPLLKRSFPTIRPISSNRRLDGAWLPDDVSVDFQYYTGDLPSLYRTESSQFPLHQGYLKADFYLQTAWGNRLAERAKGRFKVGLSWRGGTPLTRQQVRSLSITDFYPILSMSNVYFVSLQYGDVETDLNALHALEGVTVDHFPELIPDYDATAAVLTSLDLVITVCTSLVHLSGALNVPAWVMTPFSPEWRYTAYESRLLWYPSVRLYRQPQLNDWTTVCQKVAVDLGAEQKMSHSFGLQIQ